MSNHKASETLIATGGREDKVGDKDILGEVARRIGAGKLVVTTVASEGGKDELFEEYERLFRGLGLRHDYRLPVLDRQETRSGAKVRILEGAAGVFFTGGDQLRITSQIGDTPVFRDEVGRHGGSPSSIQRTGLVP
jgi:cyanophycinase